MQVSVRTMKLSVRTMKVSFRTMQVSVRIMQVPVRTMQVSVQRHVLLSSIVVAMHVNAISPRSVGTNTARNFLTTAPQPQSRDPADDDTSDTSLV
jgi:hypothetical protein